MRSIGKVVFVFPILNCGSGLQISTNCWTRILAPQSVLRRKKRCSLIRYALNHQRSTLNVYSFIIFPSGQLSTFNFHHLPSNGQLSTLIPGWSTNSCNGSKVFILTGLALQTLILPRPPSHSLHLLIHTQSLIMINWDSFFDDESSPCPPLPLWSRWVDINIKRAEGA